MPQGRNGSPAAARGRAPVRGGPAGGGGGARRNAANMAGRPRICSIIALMMNIDYAASTNTFI